MNLTRPQHAKRVESLSGRTRTIHGSFTMPGIYETGGTILDLPSPNVLIFRAGPSNGYHFSYQDGKVVAWHSAGAGPLVEVADATDLHDVTLRFKAVLQ